MKCWRHIALVFVAVLAIVDSSPAIADTRDGRCRLRQFYDRDCRNVVVDAGKDGFDLGLYYADAGGAARRVRGTAGSCVGCEWQLTLACDGNRPVLPGETVRGETNCRRAALTCPAAVLEQVWLRRPGESWTSVDTICVPVGGRLSNLYDLAAEVASAFRHLPLPAPTLHHQPAGDAVVGIPAVFYADPAASQVVPLRLDGFAVELTATAQAWEWAFDEDGRRQTTTEPGRPYPDVTVSHAYRRSRVAAPSVACEWGATFTVAGVAGVRVPVAERVRRTTTVSLRVREARAELVGGS